MVIYKGKLYQQIDTMKIGSFNLAVLFDPIGKDEILADINDVITVA